MKIDFTGVFMDMELLRFSLWLNLFLVLACIGTAIGGVFWGISVGQKLGGGVPVNMFGATEKGSVWQAPDPGVYTATQKPGEKHGLREDPLSFLDEQISRSLGQMGQKKTSSLLDPELTDQNPSQAGGGDR